MRKRIGFRVCLKCGSNTTYIDSRNYEHWHIFNDGHICSKCWHKYIGNPRVMVFKDTRVRLKDGPRKGKCLKCGKGIGDEYINAHGKVAVIKKTNMHHEQYHNDNVLKDAIEVCVSCHSKESWIKRIQCPT